MGKQTEKSRDKKFFPSPSCQLPFSLADLRVGFHDPSRRKREAHNSLVETGEEFFLGNRIAVAGRRKVSTIGGATPRQPDETDFGLHEPCAFAEA